jgi:hypothetical protein
MTYTLHKLVGPDGFGVDLPETAVPLTPTNHAENAAAECDSASCKLDEIRLPDMLKISKTGVLVGWDGSEGLSTERAVITREEKVVMDGEIFEIDVEADGTVVKVCARVSYSETHDLIVVANPRDGTLITVWANATDDTHEGLNEAKYDTPADVPALA